MKKILLTSALVATATIATADIVGPDMSTTLNVTNLATSCSFAGPLSGAMSYDEPNGQFVNTGGSDAPATMNITYRSLTTLTVTNDGVFDGKAGAITAIDYGTSNFDGTTLVAGNALAASATLTPDGALQIGTLTIDPVTVAVAVADIDDLGAYPIAFTVTCIE